MRNVVATRTPGGSRRGHGTSASLALGVLLAAATPSFAGDGDPDPAFATAGTAVLGAAPVDLDDDAGARVVVRPDGRVLVAGSQHGPLSYGFSMLQLDDAGLPDPAFGPLVDGRAVHGFAGPTQVRDLLLLPDGRLVVAFADRVAFFSAAGAFQSSRSALDLVGVPNVAPDLRALALRDDGRVVAAGSVPAASTVEFVAIVLHPDGTSDDAFGEDGVARVDAGPTAVLADAGLATDDGVVFGGSVENAPPALRDMLAVKLARDGAPDASFGDAGRLVVGVDRCGGAAQLTGENADEVVRVATDHGALVLVGRAGSLPCRSAALDDDVVVARLRACGNLDETFGGDGVVTFNASTVGGSDPTSALVQSDGAVVVGGVQRARDLLATSTGFVARIQPDGAPDTAFGDAAPVAGVHAFAPGTGTNRHAADLAFSAGRIVVAGTAPGPVTQDLAVRRLANDAQMFADSFD